MVTNALSPMRVVEALQDLVPCDTGLIGVMSSGQGSVANNETGMREVYRGSKAALNTFMRSFAARHAASPRAMVLMAPGWVRTDLGGPDARLTHGGQRPEPGQRPPFGVRRTGPPIPGLSRPYGSLVRSALTVPQPAPFTTTRSRRSERAGWRQGETLPTGRKSFATIWPPFRAVRRCRPPRGAGKAGEGSRVRRARCDPA